MGQMIGSQYHPCTPLATLFATLLGRAASAACGADWQIALADPPPVPLPVLGAPAHYRLHFSQGLRGGCYLVLEQTSFAGFLAKGAEPAAAALLGMLQEVVATLAEALAVDHGAVTVSADAATVLESTAREHGLALEARGAAGAAVMMLLYFDAELVDYFAARAATQPEATHFPAPAAGASNLDLVMDVELNCTLRFGQRQLSLREILDLASGSVVELDRQVDEPVELILDGKVIARGEAVVIDGNYGLRVTQVLQSVVY